MPPVTIIDFEASGLSDRSYPIEAAWSLNGGPVEEYLIDPSGVPAWRHWNAKAESVHGISMGRLLVEGLPPRLVCDRIRQVLTGRTVYSDHPDFDREWMRRLFEARGLPEPHLNWANYENFPCLCRLDPEVRGRIKNEARARTQPAHRATNDVRFAMLLLQLAKQGHTEKKQ